MPVSSAQSSLPKRKRKIRTFLGVAWIRIPDIAIAALVGSVVAVLISPVSQAVTYYLSEFLSKPILSIEYVEVVPIEPTVPLDASKIQDLTQAPGFMTYSIQQPGIQADLFFALRGTLSPTQAQQLERDLSFVGNDVKEKLGRAEKVRLTLASTSDPMAIGSAIKDYCGPLFVTLGFSGLPADQMKVSFLKQLEYDTQNNADLLHAVESFLPALRSPIVPMANVQFKASIFNRGETDGLLRSAGRLQFVDEQTSVDLLRIAAPKSMVDPTTVQVTVANTSEPIGENSVGKIEKHSMIEAWFAIDERALSASQRTTLATSLSNIQSKKFRVTLSDQERSEIVFVSK
jgi:hypothetical protein